MASEKYNNAENLTTDACPSPPREDNEKSNLEFTEERKQESESTKNSKNKKRKSKSKNIPTQAVANVVNMSNCVGIHMGSVITYNMGKSQKFDDEDDEEKEIIKTKAICDLMQRTDNVTKEIISFVSEHIGKNWRAVGRKLGYSQGQIHQFYETHSIVGIREVVYQILLDWIQNKPEEAKVGPLFTILWKAREKDVVQRMANNNETSTK